MSILDFLGGGGGGGASLLQLIPALLASFKGQSTGAQKATTAKLANVTDAMTNTNNPLYQQLYGQNTQMLNQNMGNALSQAEGQNRANTALGRTPLFAPERNGELAFRTMIQGQGLAGQQAQQQTEQQLSTAANSLRGNVLPAQNNQSQMGFENTALKLGGFSDIADFLRKQGQSQTNNGYGSTGPIGPLSSMYASNPWINPDTNRLSY